MDLRINRNTRAVLRAFVVLCFPGIFLACGGAEDPPSTGEFTGATGDAAGQAGNAGRGIGGGADTSDEDRGSGAETDGAGGPLAAGTGRPAAGLVDAAAGGADGGENCAGWFAPGLDLGASGACAVVLDEAIRDLSGSLRTSPAACAIWLQICPEGPSGCGKTCDCQVNCCDAFSSVGHVSEPAGCGTIRAAGVGG